MTNVLDHAARTVVGGHRKPCPSLGWEPGLFGVRVQPATHQGHRSNPSGGTWKACPGALDPRGVPEREPASSALCAHVCGAGLCELRLSVHRLRERQEHTRVRVQSVGSAGVFLRG